MATSGAPRLPTLKLYDRTRSGNCYRARLMLGLLDVSYQRIPVNTAGGASAFTGTHETPPRDHPTQAHDDQSKRGENVQQWFLAKNPRGQTPVLEVDGKCIWDSTAIIVYLARRFGGDAWLPLEPESMAEVTSWLILSQNELFYGLARARGVRQLGRKGDLAEFQSLACAGLRVMENRLANNPWLALDHITIADVACYPYVAQSDDSGIAIGDYPAICRWLKQIESLPGYLGPTA